MRSEPFSSKAYPSDFARSDASSDFTVSVYDEPAAASAGSSISTFAITSSLSSGALRPLFVHVKLLTFDAVSFGRISAYFSLIPVITGLAAPALSALTSSSTTIARRSVEVTRTGMLTFFAPADT